MRIAAGLLTALAAGCMAGGAAAQTETEAQAVQLTGGASAITETHGNWTVNCQVVNNTKVCSTSYQQFDGKNQRVFAVELSPREGKAFGNAALPFGLALQKGTSLTVDDRAIGETRPFSTCVSGGCLVPLSFDAATLTVLNRGSTLKIKGVALETEREIEFSVPLAGFASAMGRTVQLLKD